MTKADCQRCRQKHSAIEPGWAARSDPRGDAGGARGRDGRGAAGFKERTHAGARGRRPSRRHDDGIARGIQRQGQVRARLEPAPYLVARGVCRNRAARCGNCRMTCPAHVRLSSSRYQQSALPAPKRRSRSLGETWLGIGHSRARKAPGRLCFRLTARGEQTSCIERAIYLDVERDSVTHQGHKAKDFSCTRSWHRTCRTSRTFRSAPW